MPDAFLTASIVGFALTVNAMRPFPGLAVAVPSFFASWLTMELAPHLLAAHAAGVAAFALAGGIRGWRGAAGLVLSAGTAAGLLQLIAIAQRTRGIVEDALRQGLGANYAERIATERPAHHDLRAPWRELILPFRMKHPDVERTKNISYGEVRRRNLLDVYRPKAGTTGAPVLLQIHGGGWTISNKNQQGKPIMLHLASRGWVCIAPNYRMSPKHAWPAHIVDVKRALAWIREHIAEYGGDPDFVVVTGGSAGGHLAALAALSANDPEYQPGFEDIDTTIQGCVPYYGVYDFTGLSGTRQALWQRRMIERIVLKRSYAEHPHEFERASPLFRVRSEAPPFFVIHGRRDSLVPVAETRTFVARLREVSRAPVAYAELPGAQHAFDVFPSIRTAHVIRAVERFSEWCRLAHAGADPRRAPAEAHRST